MILAIRDLHKALSRSVSTGFPNIPVQIKPAPTKPEQIKLNSSLLSHSGCLTQIRNIHISPPQVHLPEKSPRETIRKLLEPHSNPSTFPTPPKNYPRMLEQTYSGDILEESLHIDGHRAWGFVIYRCTYKNDADCAAFLRLLLDDTKKMLLLSAGELDLLRNLALTIFDDPTKFDGVTAAVVREHFKDWAAAAPVREQGAGKGLCPKPGFVSQRYAYCLQVGEEELESVLRPASRGLNDSFVRLVAKDWESGSEDDVYDCEEPVEGCVYWDVGWMKVRFHGVMVQTYVYLRDDSMGWEQYYRRPPCVASF